MIDHDGLRSLPHLLGLGILLPGFSPLHIIWIQIAIGIDMTGCTGKYYTIVKSSFSAC